MNAFSSHNVTARELRWLRHIAIHGPQSSEFLLELVSDTHRCRDTGLRILQKLRETRYLRLPAQQKQITKADFNPYVYDLTRQSQLYLTGLSDSVTVPPTGHWWHGFLTSCIASAIAIEATRRGYNFIPAHSILALNHSTLSIPFKKQKLIPDQLFAINYGGSFRSFVLEVDRGTEPYRSEAARKSLTSMLRLYDEVWAQDAARTHYGLKSPLLILMAFTNPTRAAKCLEEIAAKTPRLAPYVLVKTVTGGFPRWGAVSQGVRGQWRRCVGEGLGLV